MPQESETRSDRAKNDGLLINTNSSTKWNFSMNQLIFKDWKKNLIEQLNRYIKIHLEIRPAKN